MFSAESTSWDQYPGIDRRLLVATNHNFLIKVKFPASLLCLNEDLKDLATEWCPVLNKMNRYILIFFSFNASSPQRRQMRYLQSEKFMLELSLINSRYLLLFWPRELQSPMWCSRCIKDNIALIISWSSTNEHAKKEGKQGRSAELWCGGENVLKVKPLG